MEAQWMQRFVDFGVDSLLSHSTLVGCHPQIARFDASGDSPSDIRRQLRQHVAERAPRCPGVYGMIDALGRLVYVGKSKLLRNRLLSYFMPGNNDEKAGRIVDLARSIVWEKQPSEFAALLREQSLIRRWQPTLNVVGMPNRRQSAFLCLGRGPAEQFYISRQYDATASACHGPFAGSGQLQRAIEILNRHFLLRDCSQKTTTHLTDQLSLFVIESRAGCLRAELGTCIAPCQVGSLRSQYLAQEQLARKFASGDPLDTVQRLEAEMQRAAEGQHYERAARLREDIRIIKWIVTKLGQHRIARESSPRIYWEPFETEPATATLTGFPAQGILYLIRHGGIEAAIACPANERQWKSARRAIADWHASEQRLNTQWLRSVDSLGLVTAWFQKNPHLKKRLFPIASLDALPTTWSALRSEWLAVPAAA